MRIDVKNHRQTNVAWRVVEQRALAENRETTSCAYDMADGALIGSRRSIPVSTSLRAANVDRRFKAAGIKLAIWPVGTIMPMEQGIGMIDDVGRPGRIPCLALDRLLAQPSIEPSFNSADPASQVALSFFSSIVKDDNGRARRI